MADACNSLCTSCLELLSISNSNEEETCQPSKRIKLDDNNNETLSHTVCQHCLDALDVNFQENVVQQISDRLKNGNYVGLKSFQLCIQITPSVIMQHGVILKWLNQSGKLSESDISELDETDSVKETLKRNLIHVLMAKLDLKAKVNSPFQILVELKHDDADKACHMLVASKNTSKKKPPRKRYNAATVPTQPQLTISTVQNAIDLTSYDEAQRFNLLPFQISYSSQLSVAISLTHDSVFVAGRYNKYSRTLSQTPWILDGVRKAETSVQELMSDQLVKKIRYESLKLSSSGREDVDVRMLGPGRPFLLELVKPKVINLTDDDYKKIEMEINTSTKDIAVCNLCEVNSDSNKILKDGEENKKKTYSALVYCRSPITEEKIKFLDDICDLKIAQRTPIRVLHRRSLAVRERTIYSLKTTFIDSNHFKLVLVTEAGTYIKEFVHGDFGRTVPNLCALIGCDVDVRALDVTDLQLEWPPQNASKR